jgi:hypothetical protein
MRPLRLLFVCALATPAVGCFITADGERYEDTYGNDSDGGNGGHVPCGSGDVGSEGCACTSGGSCNPTFQCNTNLNICISDACPVGTETCFCTPMGACDPNLVCLSDFCVDPGPQCPAGTEACPCTQGEGCGEGLVCLSEVCVDPSGLTTGEQTTVAPEESSSGGSEPTTGTTAADETSSSSGPADPDSTG